MRLHTYSRISFENPRAARPEMSLVCWAPAHAVRRGLGSLAAWGVFLGFAPGENHGEISLLRLSRVDRLEMIAGRGLITGKCRSEPPAVRLREPITGATVLISQVLKHGSPFRAAAFRARAPPQFGYEMGHPCHVASRPRGRDRRNQPVQRAHRVSFSQNANALVLTVS